MFGWEGGLDWDHGESERTFEAAEEGPWRKFEASEHIQVEE